jgi:hypothetical protein
MIYFLALLPATVLTIGGYFVLFLSNRSEGSFRTVGRYLGFWSFALAALVILGSIFAAAQGGRHHAMYYRTGPGFGRMRGAGPGFMMRRFGGFRGNPGSTIAPPSPNSPASPAPKPSPNPEPPPTGR